MYDHVVKGNLPPVTLTAATIERLRELFGSDGPYAWEAEVGIGGDKLGAQKIRPSQTVTDWDELITLLANLDRIDYLTLTVEVSGTGVIAIAFRNYPPAGGSFVITSVSQEWPASKSTAIQEVFAPLADAEAARCYNRWAFAAIQTAIPMGVAFFLVLALAYLFTPRALAHSDYIWWLTAATVMATLWVAHRISDYFVLYVLNRYPYLRWK